ncbi:MAG: 50S ribosomal protein L9 [Candidatus Shikimatogenerans bostrichidophilus]|nr:MAG: 50S ribosomal protein L9 [Candidatus Shikimatogenerans bostrichidophilus]
MVKIILKKKINKLGNINDIIIVKFGYAINYLIPNNLAVIATKSEIKKNNEIIKQIKNKEIFFKKKYKYYINKLKNINLIYYINKNKNNKIFNIINKTSIKEKLEKHNIFVNKKNIYIENKINDLGDYKIIIKFFEEKKIFLNIKILNKNNIL